VPRPLPIRESDERTGDDDRFPLEIATAGIVATGVGLMASALGVQWGAHAPDPDALELSWIYVNVAMAWTWLLVWPAVGLCRERFDSVILLWDFLVLLACSIPAMGVAAFLSNVTPQMIGTMALLQVALGLFAMGAMNWRDTIGAGIISASLAVLGVATPIAAYIWMEFFPAASQAWIAFVPIVAITRVAKDAADTLTWWTAGSYAFLGLILWATAPRPKKAPRP
jgi:hypothetical protein